MIHSLIRHKLISRGDNMVGKDFEDMVARGVLPDEWRAEPYECIDPEDVKVTYLENTQAVRELPDFDDHECVAQITNEAGGVVIYVGVHNTELGTSLGGFRVSNYKDDTDAVTDVLRLSRGMTYKSAAAELPLGGGKAVALARPRRDDPDDVMLETFARGLNILNAKRQTRHGLSVVYLTAEDSNTNPDHMRKIYRHSPYATGIAEKEADPSPQTAAGVLAAMKVAFEEKFGNPSLEGRTVAVQGVGNVGMHLVRLLKAEGAARIIVSDRDQDKLQQVEKDCGVEVVGVDEIYDQEVDCFAPCALGGILTTENVERLYQAGVSMVVGSANNQEADETNHAQSMLMKELGILYVQDFIANSGGVIWVYKEHDIIENPEEGPEVKNHIVDLVTGNTRRLIALMNEHNVHAAEAARRIVNENLEAARREADRALSEGAHQPGAESAVA